MHEEGSLNSLRWSQAVGVGNWEFGRRNSEFGMDRDPPDREIGRDVALPRLTKGGVRSSELGR